MDSLLVRSVALSLDSDVHCVVNASRSTADGTFAVASSRDGVIRVYAASCGALLHEFSSIHKRIHALHYTSFSDSLVTIESDAVARPNAADEHDDAEDQDDDVDGLDETETFLCVYHDWRESRRVRGYTLPLGVLESACGARRKADCVAVCSFSGRVVVAMGTVINIWQCSQGFFEHVMEIKVEMSQQHAFLLVEYVAIHGVYVAYASQTEVRVMEIHVRNTKELETNTSTSTSTSASTSTNTNTNDNPTATKKNKQRSDSPPQWPGSHQTGNESSSKSLSSGSLLKSNRQTNRPEDSANCVSVKSFGDLQQLIEIPVVSSSSRASSKMEDLRSNQQQQSDSFLEDQEESPIILGRDEAQQEAYHLAGLVKEQDIRVNQALDYFVGPDDVTVLLRRYLPPNHRLQSLRFLPETIDNRVGVESRSYARLLVATERNAFLYYFLSPQVDTTRNQMARKLLGKSTGNTGGMHEPFRMGKVIVGQDGDFFASMDHAEAPKGELGASNPKTSRGTDFLTESGRVVMQYTFTSPMCCITANSSFLFAATLSGLQIWSIWSPCHHIAASQALSKTLIPQPTQPQLLCSQQLPFVASDIAALDSCVILLPRTRTSRRAADIAPDLVRISSLVAEELLPDMEIELRGGLRCKNECLLARKTPNILIFLQSPPSRVFAFVRENILQQPIGTASGATGAGAGTGGATGASDAIQSITADQIDLLLSLFSLYRYRANVGMELLEYKQAGRADSTDDDEQKQMLSLELETRLYDSLARECAAELATVFTSLTHLNLRSAALLYVASNLAAPEVLRRLSEIMKYDQVTSSQVMEATAQYLEGFVFPTSDMTPSLGNKLLSDRPLVKPSSANSPGSTSSSVAPYFTRAVLMHYGDNAPEQISRIVVDSSLEWTLDDIYFGLQQLTENKPDPSVLVQVAALVLVLRASGFAPHEWTCFAHQHQLKPLCDFQAIRQRVVALHGANHDALIHLCGTHPDLLVVARNVNYVSPKEISRPFGLESGHVDVAPSLLAQALLETVPHTFESILEHIFEAAILREELVLRATLFCCCVFGAPADRNNLARLRAAARGTHGEVMRLELERHDVEVFTTREASLVRWLFFVLGKFHWLNRLQEQGQLQETEENLRQVQHAICHEFIQRCVQLFVHLTASSSTQDQQQRTVLANRFDEMFSAEDHVAMETVRDKLPHWVHEFVQKRCLGRLESTAVSPTMHKTLHHLLLHALALIPFMNCNLLIAIHEHTQKSPDEFSTLIALLAYPQLSRTIDGLALIAKRSEYLDLFLPYGKCFCNTLEEWRFLIQSLASVSQETKAEKAILENILNHVCSTLNTEDLLQVLPDDGDLALYMASVENSLRLNEARGKAIEKTQPPDDTDDLFFHAARNHLGSIVP